MKKITSLFLLLLAALFGLGQNKKTANISDSITPLIVIAKEPRFLLNVHSGYSMGLGSTFKFYPDDIRSISLTKIANNPGTKITTYANPTKGLGDGFKFGFGGSFVVNDFINIGLDLDYFNSTIQKTRDSSFKQIADNSGANTDYMYQYRERNVTSYKATLLSLTPNITFKAISRPKWFMYNKLGIIVTFRPNSLQDDVTDVYTSTGWQGFYKDSSSRIVKKYEWGIKNPAYGFMGGIGMQAKLANRVRFFVEAQFSHIVFVIKKRTLTDFMVDNINMANTVPKSQKEILFVSAYTANSAAADPDKPSQTITQRIPITYIGLQAGLVFQLK